jgi:hypothetical protein
MSERFVRVKFSYGGREYTYRADPDAVFKLGGYATPRKRSGLVTITAIDCEPVPNLALDKYDWVDPVPVPEEEEEQVEGLDEGPEDVEGVE